MGARWLGIALILVGAADVAASTGHQSGVDERHRRAPSPATDADRVGQPGAGLPTLLPEAVLEPGPDAHPGPGAGESTCRWSLRPTRPDHFPYCNVAEYLPALSRPGRPGATFIYAHARAGMFLPILEQSRRERRAAAARAWRWTSSPAIAAGSRIEVTEVHRHVTSLETAYRATAEQLILQTSEGPGEHVGQDRPDRRHRAAKPKRPPRSHSRRPTRFAVRSA